tara:strand:+ start:451 stop:837 length:387 start_codon:yes stop_codon:yes gene_type:complete
MCIKTKKTKQLGMNPSTASSRLKKELLYSLAKKLKINWCYQCGNEIETAKRITVEHKTPWLDSSDPAKLFFDLNNIAFSHSSCNYSAARARAIAIECPSTAAYRRGCRCEECKAAKSEYRKNRLKFKY